MFSYYVDLVIYFYIFICLALLVYNLLYILLAKGKTKTHSRRGDLWYRELEAEIRRLEEGGSVSPSHQRRMMRKLKKIRHLMGYHDAVTRGIEAYSPEMIRQYLGENRVIFRALAVEYGKHPAMERAYYAHLMGVYRTAYGKGESQLPRILLGYLENSTIFCRENVLHALYAIGQPEPVENALAMLQDRGWYHNPRLLSDGLAAFTGDREELARRLWARCQAWDENLQVAVVQFITTFSDAFAPAFLAALQQRSLYLEGQFALVRYFQRRFYPPAKEALLQILAGEADSNLSIAAAAALARYPGEDTWQALMQAVRSRNYYVRKNAAQSLASLGADGSCVRQLQEAGDRYAAEMLEYMLRQKENKQPAAVPPEQAKEVLV